MANDSIKDFVSKQTGFSPLRVPRTRGESEQDVRPTANELVREEPITPQAPVVPERVSRTVVEKPTPKKIGRPKCDRTRKISGYISDEMLEKLEAIQHLRKEKSLNAVVVDALTEYLSKY